MVREAKACRRVLLVALVCVSGAAFSPAAGTAGFGTPAALAAAKPGPVDRAVAAVQAAQRADGGFGVAPGATRSDPATSVWAALALEAVGVHPADQPGRGTTVLSYLERRGAALTDTGDLARLALVLRAADADGDLLPATTAKLVARQRADGGWSDAATGPARVAASSFAILALAGATDDAGRAALARGGAWLQGAARGGSGWGVAPGGAPRADQTGLALQALRAALPDEFELTSGAQSFLNAGGNADGGLGGARASRSDAVATAFAMQGLRATGIDPATFSGLDGATAGAYLTADQRPNGSFGSTLRTAQVLAGLDGVAFPLPSVTRGSERASAAAPKVARKNGAAGGATAGGAAALSGGQAGGTSTSSGAPGASSSSSGSGSASSGSSATGVTSGGSSSASAAPSAPAAPSASSTPSGSATSSGSVAATPPASGGSAAKSATTPAPAASSGSGSAVDGVVVGATPAAATTLAAVATGGGGGDDAGGDPALVLAGAMVALALGGAALEHRRPRKVLS